MPRPLWPGSKVIKLNFKSIISQTNNDCSLCSLNLAKPLLLDISCGNIFALSIAIALTACFFLIKKCAKMNVFFLCKNSKKSLAEGGSAPRPPWSPEVWDFTPRSPIVLASPQPNPGCADGDNPFYFFQPVRPRLQNFFQCGPSRKKFAQCPPLG